MKTLFKLHAILAMMLVTLIPARGQSSSVTVAGKANIFAAGRGVAFDGVVPPAVRFAARAGNVVTFPSVAGTIACNGIAYEPLHGPDGTVNRCGGTGTNIGSWAGISGIVHKTRQMFLVGVFLDEREPSDPAPDRLDFSTSENYSTLAPLIGQVFFIGDGRSASGALQQVTAPAAATRLYLGFADALAFSGSPQAYNDNNGSLQVTVAGVTPFVPGPVATGTTMTVNGKSSIYWSGLDVNWPTDMPPGWKFTAAPGRVLTVRASGSVTCKTGISAPPEGTSACGAKTDLEPYGSISGIEHPSRSMFLVGVFLNDLKPRGWPPTALDFTNDGFTTLEPLIGQVFYVGTGSGKRFVVPHDATRVFLGYARSDLMIGNPGYYSQGGGSLTATIDLTGGTDTGVSPVQVDSKSNLYAAGRETAFDGYLPPMVRLKPGPGKVLTVPQVTGKVRCCGGGYTTADGASYHTNLNAYLGLSGIQAKWRGYFLAGVFLDDNVPDGAPPEKLVFTEPFDFLSLEPKIGQVFLIGDGVTTKGVPHEFSIPAAATRLYLGFALGRLFTGDPGYYWESSDSYTATLNIGGGTTPPPPCSYALGETARSMPAAAGTGSVTVTTTAGCAWTAASGAAWITVTSGATGSGAGTLGYAVAANTGPARTGTLTIAGQTLTISQAAGTAACTYSINPTTQTAPAAGGTVTVQVTAGTGCAWTAASNAAWLTVTAGASGTGNGAVTLTAAANTGAARSGTATIAGQTLTVNQAAPTTSTVTITDVVNDADLTPAFAPGGAVFIRGRNFAAADYRLDGGVPWPNQLEGISVEVTDGGRTLAAPIGGIGLGWVTAQLPFGISATVDLRVVTPAGRSSATTISVAARSPRLYTVDGSGKGAVWAYHPDYTEVTPSAPAKPGEEILLVGTGFGAVSPPVQAGQLGINPAGGAEPNRVTDTVDVEIQGITVRPRLAILDYYLAGAYVVVFTVPAQVTSQSPSVLVRVGGAASQRDVSLPVKPGTGPGTCTYAVSPASAQIPAAGGSGSASVNAGTGCAWTASSNQTWLKVTSGASGTGNGTVSYAADANSGAARTATLTIAGQTLTVNQAAAAVPGTGPSIAAGGVVNAADYTPNLAPGMLFAIFGSNCAAGVKVANAIPLPNTLDGVSVEVVDGVRVLNAPLVFIAPGQVNAQMPFDITSSRVQVRIRNAQGVSNAQTVTITPRAPRLLTQSMDGKGDAMVVHSDYSLVTADSPASPGEVLILYLTGLGAVAPPVAAGQAAGDGTSGRPLNLVTDKVTVTVGGTSTTVHFSGLAPNFAGLYQINFEVPGKTSLGSRSIAVSVANRSSQSSTTLFVGTKWTAGGSATIGPEGGTVTGGATTVKISDGELAKPTPISIGQGSGPHPLDPYRISAVEMISGLSMPIRRPLTITTNLSKAPQNPDQVYLVLQPGGEGFAPTLIKAQVSGTRVTATFAGVAGGTATTKSSARSAGAIDWLLNIPPKLVVTFVQSFTNQKLEGDTVSINYPSALDDESLTLLYAGLRQIDSVFSGTAAAAAFGLGISFRHPIQVDVIPSGLTAEPWGGVNTLEQSIAVSSDYLKNSPASVTAKLAHLYIHYLQQFFYVDVNFLDDNITRVRRDVFGTGNSWLWLDEAVATWAESQIDKQYIPDEVYRNSSFLTVHGLEYGPPSQVLGDRFELDSIRQHGYGASLFLRELELSFAFRSSFLERLLRFRAMQVTEGIPLDHWRAMMPVEVLKNLGYNNGLLDFGPRWLEFCVAYTEGRLSAAQAIRASDWRQRVLDLAISADHTAEIASDSDQAGPFQWSSTDLAAQFYRITFPYTWVKEGDLKIKLDASSPDAGASGSALLYKVSVDGAADAFTYIGTFHANETYTIKNASATFAEPKNSLLIVVVNTRNLPPFTATSNFSLSLQAGNATAPPSVGNGLLIIATGPPVFNCPTSWGSTIRADLDFSTGETVPKVPVLWNGDTFAVATAPNQTVQDYSGNTMSMAITGTVPGWAKAMSNGSMSPLAGASAKVQVTKQAGQSRYEFNFQLQNLTCKWLAYGALSCGVPIPTFSASPDSYMTNVSVTFNGLGCTANNSVTGTPADPMPARFIFSLNRDIIP